MADPLHQTTRKRREPTGLNIYGETLAEYYQRQTIAVQQAGEKLAQAVREFLNEVRQDDGDPWGERPTQDIFKDWHPIQEALREWKQVNG